MKETFVVILYGIVGFFGAISLALTFGGYVFYLIRIGVEGRDEGIRLMEWGFSTLFVVTLVAILIRFLA